MGARFGDWLRRVFGRTLTARNSPAEVAPPVARAHNGWFEDFLEESGFLRHFPHYAGVLARMSVVLTPAVPVMAVALWRRDQPGSRIHLLVNPEYFSAHPEYRVGVLLHEVQHVLCGHLDDATFHRVAYPRVMEAAMEMTANEPIEFPLPAGAIRHQEFASLGLAPGQSTLARYILLRDAVEDGRLDEASLWSPRMLDTHRPRDLGEGGSGLGDLLDARSDRSSLRNWSRAGGGLGPPDSRATLERMKSQIALHLCGERGGEHESMREGSELQAKELERYLITEPASGALDWRRILHEALPRRRRIRSDYLRPNRRYPARVGEIPGRRRWQQPPRLVVGIDSSGSMTSAALERISRELPLLARHAQLTIVECDAVVHRVYPYGAQLPTVVGGGDTDLRPVFDEAARDREYDGLVYFTDGKGDRPELPPDIPTVWALMHEDPFLTDFGVVVRVP